jgi:hypothetical protein
MSQRERLPDRRGADLVDFAEDTADALGRRESSQPKTWQSRQRSWQKQPRKGQTSGRFAVSALGKCNYATRRQTIDKL